MLCTDTSLELSADSNHTTTASATATTTALKLWDIRQPDQCMQTRYAEPTHKPISHVYFADGGQSEGDEDRYMIVNSYDNGMTMSRMHGQQHGSWSIRRMRVHSTDRSFVRSFVALPRQVIRVFDRGAVITGAAATHAPHEMVLIHALTGHRVR